MVVSADENLGQFLRQMEKVLYSRGGGGQENHPASTTSDSILITAQMVSITSLSRWVIWVISKLTRSATEQPGPPMSTSHPSAPPLQASRTGKQRGAPG